MRFPVFPLRQIHLDFHTSPEIPDVGADWNADHFVETLQRARVNSITVFATCHHGMSYYPSKVATVHPSLNFDLLGAQIEACHKAGIRCPIYLTVAWNVDAAQRHPEWRQIDINGKQVGATPLEAGWPWLCVRAGGDGYAHELLAQTDELIDRYGDECDGFFYDILMVHADGCLCVDCLKSLRDSGLDPTNALHRRRNNHATARRFMEWASGLIRSRLPNDDTGIFYNSRWGMHFADEQQYYSQVEIESLPTGGWGYAFYPLWSRYGRQFGLPMLGMTGRFHRSWADWGGLKHPDALKFECGGILANGGAVSIGDQLHPRGRLNDAVYDVIGEAFTAVEAVEPYCIGAVSETQIGLLILSPDADKANEGAAGIVSASGQNIEGAAKILIELHQQFDVISDKTCPDFSRYELLVLADRAIPSDETVARLKAFVAGGGKLLLSWVVLKGDEPGDNFALADEMGVDYIGAAVSNPDYFELTEPALLGPVTRAGFAYSYYDGPAARVRPRPGTEVLADAYETYFNRTGAHFSSHGFTPAKESRAEYPAITRKGNVIYLHGPVFSAYQKYGNLTFRALVGKCLDLLLTKTLTTDAPPSAEVTLMRHSGDGGNRHGNRHVVHVVNYSPQRRAPGHVEVLDAPIPLRDVSLTLRTESPVSRVFEARSGETLPHTVGADGAVSVVVSRIDAHTVVVWEY